MTETDLTQQPHEFAQFRNWCCEDTVTLAEFSSLSAAWERTRRTLADIRERLQRAELPSEIETVYVCGSMGRMEQLPGSDCDLVIVAEGSTVPDSDRGRELFRLVWDQLSDLEFERPKSAGIFSQVVSWNQLVDRSSLGVVDEDQCVYGTRMQLLLDSQPVNKSARFQILASEVISRAQQFDANGNSNWIPLLSELMRYWRSLCTRTFWISSLQPGVRRTITVKLNHSRLVLIAGFLCLLGDAATRVNDSCEYLQQRIRLTPLERIGSANTQTSAIQEIVSSYDQFLARMSDGEFVQRLADPEVETLHTSEFTQLEQNSQRLKTALVSLIAERSNSWPAAFRESLLL
ncbi:MAG TPA: DUF294 nucleotidyltransferase-like domain-containing protein [Planctomycetaceae bacterium]|nr:DUF294 nucleotidyltransferase-like domain-containing protein [Planctomycetaceae bacterium]